MKWNKMFEWLLDSGSFVTRNSCGHWDKWLILTNQIANFLIFLSYISIPLSLTTYFLFKAKGEGLRDFFADNGYMVIMFGLFILSCGLTHLMDVLAFSWAPYRFFTLIDCITAALSVSTALMLPLVISKIFEVTADAGKNKSP